MLADRPISPVEVAEAMTDEFEDKGSPEGSSGAGCFVPKATGGKDQKLKRQARHRGALSTSERQEASITPFQGFEPFLLHSQLLNIFF